VKATFTETKSLKVAFTDLRPSYRLPSHRARDVLPVPRPGRRRRAAAARRDRRKFAASSMLPVRRSASCDTGNTGRVASRVARLESPRVAPPFVRCDALLHPRDQGSQRVELGQRRPVPAVEQPGNHEQPRPAASARAAERWVSRWK